MDKKQYKTKNTQKKIYKAFILLERNDLQNTIKFSGP